MKEYIGVMMTSRGCGHCAQSRGNGIMGSGPHFMKPSAIDELLSISDKLTVLNIHFESMAGKKSQIREISKFSKHNNTIKEDFWSIGEGNTINYHNVNADTKTKKITQSGSESIKNDSGDVLNWQNFLNEKIPDKIENYTYYYPCFFIVKTQNWLNSIKNGEELYAITNAGKTRKDTSGKVFLDRSGQSFNERMVEPKKLFTDITSGSVSLEPHIIDSDEVKKEVKEEVKKEVKEEVKKEVKEEVKKEVKNEIKKMEVNTRYTIKQY